MNLSQMIATIQFRLGNKKHIDEHIVNEIRLAQNALERDPKLNLWFLFRSFTFQAYVGERTYPMPNNYIKMCEMYQPYFIDANNAVSRLTRKPADLVFRPTTGGVPRYYGFQADMFITDVEADGVYRIFYYASDDELVVGTREDNDWTRKFPSVIVTRAAMNVAKTLRDMDLFNVLNAEYQVEYRNLFEMCVAQDDVGYDVARGDFQ